MIGSTLAFQLSFSFKNLTPMSNLSFESLLDPIELPSPWNIESDVEIVNLAK
jgi:hypothetical protein